MSSRSGLIGSVLASAVCGVTPVFAQTTDPAAPQKPAYVFTLSGGATYDIETDFRGDGGSMSVFRSSSAVKIDHAFTEATSLRVGFDGEYSHYYFRNNSAVPGADDNSDSLDLYQFDVRPVLTHYFSPNFGLFAGVNISAAGMADADIGDSMSYAVLAGVNYKLGDNVWLGAGFVASTQLEDDAFVVPLLTLNWQVTPKLLLASEGLGFRASYKFDNEWSAYAKIAYEFRQYRLDSGEVISDGAITDQAIPVTVGVTYTVGDSLDISAEAGVVAWRRMKFRDSGGDDVAADETDPAPFVGFSVRYSF